MGIRHRPLLLLIFSLAWTQASLADIYKKPVVQKRIPGPGEAVKEMGRMQADRSVLLVDVTDEASKEKERSGEDPLPPGLMGAEESMEFSEGAQFSAQAAEDRPPARAERPAPAPAPSSPPAKPSPAPAPVAAAKQEPPTPTPAAVPTAQPTVEPGVHQQLEALARRRSRGELSGEAYLAERHRIIHGTQPRPVDKPVYTGEPSVEQQLESLKQQRLRGEISGEAYLQHRRQVIHGQR